MAKPMVPFHNMSAFFFISHVPTECSAATVAWRDVIDIRFSFSETACVKRGKSASPFRSQLKSILQAIGAKRHVRKDLLYISEN